MDRFRYGGYILFVCCTVLVVGCAVIAGWLFHISALTSILPGYTTMKFNTATCFILLSLSLFYYTGRFSPRWQSVSRWLAIAALILAALTLAQYVSGHNLGIDQLLVADWQSVAEGRPNPGRMSPFSTISFSILALALFNVSGGGKIYRLAVQWLLHLVTMVAFVAILGYLFNVPAFYRFSVFVSMALHTALAFFLLSIAVTLINPSYGVAGLFTGNRIGNVMARKMFLQMVVAILFLTVLRLLSHRYMVLSVEFGIALFSTSIITLSLFVIWSVAEQLNKIDLQKNEAESNLARVKTFLDSTPDPILVIDAIGAIRITNNKLEHVFGYNRQELSGHSFDLLLPQRFKADYEKQRLAIFSAPADTNLVVEIFVRKKNGDEFPVEVSFSRVESVDGLFIAVAIRDITVRRQVELDLKQSNERNRIFVEQAPNALAMFDTEMCYMAASRKWLEDYNLVGKNIIGRSHYEIFPEIGDDWKAIHRECLNGATNQTEEAPFERADGTLQWITWDVRPWYITAGQIGGLL
ncbi:MAG TPA: PAS domain S-box protein, partial [Chitinophagales bacterium]|nr:PAS domain S-box protein [Chitinophagales bacterium]